MKTVDELMSEAETYRNLLEQARAWLTDLKARIDELEEKCDAARHAQPPATACLSSVDESPRQAEATVTQLQQQMAKQESQFKLIIAQAEEKHAALVQAQQAREAAAELRYQELVKQLTAAVAAATPAAAPCAPAAALDPAEVQARMAHRQASMASSPEAGDLVKGLHY